MALVLAPLLTATTAEAASLPPQGLYEECAPANQAQCAGELAKMGTAGFRLALNYTAWYGSAAEIQAYAHEAHAQGIKLIWPLNDSAWRGDSSLIAEYPALAATCACTTNEGFVRYAVSLVRSLPATWGYYVGDELDPSDAPAVASLAAQVRAVDPLHPLLYISQSVPDVFANLKPFAASANVVGADVYPVGAGSLVSVVSRVATEIKQVARRTDKRAAIVLQAFSWAQYPAELQAIDPDWPTGEQMRSMRDRAAASDPSMILWYNLSDIESSSDPAGHWRELVTGAFGRRVQRVPFALSHGQRRSYQRSG